MRCKHVQAVETLNPKGLVMMTTIIKGMTLGKKLKIKLHFMETKKLWKSTQRWIQIRYRYFQVMCSTFT